jgi:hypothetical protein
MSTKIANTSANANSICIPRAFANISEARVRKVFDALNIFVIDRIDMIQRKNEKGDAYQRIFVHIREWSNTTDADKARERLLSGKELKIVYDEPWFWKVSLNNWTPKPAVPVTSIYDRKPRIRLEFEDKDEAKEEEEEEELPYHIRWGDELARRKRQSSQETIKNKETAADFLSSISLEDQRPYRERRLDPILCEQDVQSGFRDRRLPSENTKKQQRKSRFSDKTAEPIPVKKEKPIVDSPKPETLPLPIAPGLPDIVVKNPTPPIVKNPTPPLNKDPYLVIKMQAYFRTEITDEIYLNNRQMMREMLKDAKDAELEETEIIDYGKVAAPKKKGRKIVA